MTDESRKLLKDIEFAILNIDLHLEGRRVLADYMNNITRKRAVERELEIIGEAVGKLLKVIPDIPISSARKIVNVRNRVIHAYDEVDDIIIWKIVAKDIPILLEEVRALMAL